MHELPLLVNIAAALVVAFIGGVLVRRLGLPTIVGYLLAGIVIGPFTPGFVGDSHTIKQLAELGVIFLMFGVGLHFSIADLWRVRDMALPGALSRMVLVTLLGLGLATLWGWSVSAGIVLGLAISIASTVVLLRGLMDNSLLNTPHGQVAVGWVVMEDLATVLILVLLPSLAGSDGGPKWANLAITLGKAVIFVLLILFVGMRLIPWLLHFIARTRSRELFILAILAIALGIALGSAELFGVSLALGAFAAGAVVSESPLSHQVGADLLPFRDVFSALFFVSIGMLVNPLYLWQNIGPVLALTLLIVLGKFVITLLLGTLLSSPARTALVVGAGLSQIGEFSFILGQAGVSLGLLAQDQYSLILAGALISITLNPLMFRLIGPVEVWLRRIPAIWERLDRHGPVPVSAEETLANHVVLVGCGRVGYHIVNVVRELKIPLLVIESNVERVEALNRLGTPTLFGDAANSEVLTYAGLDRARALVVTLPEETSSELVVVTARDLAPTLPIIARAATTEGVMRLAQLGVQDVIHPEMEGGLEIVRHTLLQIGFPLREVFRYTDAVRKDHYDVQINSNEEHRLLRNLLEAAGTIEISWLRLADDSPLIGQTLAEANLRARTGASVVVISRDGQLIPNPKSLTVFQVGDRIGLIGDNQQVDAVAELLNPNVGDWATDTQRDRAESDAAEV
ncbi:MAG: cation:proton antiporter [Anaerolineae bacterium]|nr:cation:proton antiporter [Anaerolineae bacterium]